MIPIGRKLAEIKQWQKTVIIKNLRLTPSSKQIPRKSGEFAQRQSAGRYSLTIQLFFDSKNIAAAARKTAIPQWAQIL